MCRLLVAMFCILNLNLVSAAEVEFLNTETAKKAKLPFSQAVRVGNTVYLSGNLGLVPGTRTLAEGGVAGETKQTMDNIARTLKAFGFSMDRLVKCTVMLADIKDWPKFNKVYVTYFGENKPARSVFGTSGLAFNARVEIECIAAL